MKWTDLAIDGLQDRVDATDRRLDRMREDARDAAAEEVRRVDALHARLDRQDSKMAEGFREMREEVKAVAADTRQAARSGARLGASTAVSWANAFTYFVAIAGGIGVPLAIAWALSGGPG